MSREPEFDLACATLPPAIMPHAIKPLPDADAAEMVKLVRRVANWLERQVEHTENDYETILRGVSDRLERVLMRAPQLVEQYDHGRRRYAGAGTARLARTRVPSRREIQSARAAVAAAFGLDPKVLDGPRRSGAECAARWMYWHVVRTRYGGTLQQLAAWCGGRNHTSIAYGLNNLAGLLKRDTELQARLRKCLEQLGVQQEAA